MSLAKGEGALPQYSRALSRHLCEPMFQRKDWIYIFSIPPRCLQLEELCSLPFSRNLCLVTLRGHSYSSVPYLPIGLRLPFVCPLLPHLSEAALASVVLCGS